MDSNGDGIGDLQGIISKLEYIAELGVDAVWISPFFTSPMRDFGYDVADYRGVDEIFGTLDDFDRLVEAAHRLGLKVIIDQVYSHTSDQHAWFQESRQDQINPKADWYVWADPKPDGTPPNNWLAVFGGASWSWDSRRGQYYLHNFLSSQPDLNVHNKDVQNALLDVARFWLDRGVDGFRLDAINFTMHDLELRDNPPAKLAQRSYRTFDFQQHKYNQSHPDIVRFLERLRSVIDGYPDRFTVAEIGGPDALPELQAFTRGSKRLNSAYSFDYLYAESVDPEHIRRTSLDWPCDEMEGWPSWAFSNHDAPRFLSRWHDGSAPDAFSKLMALLLLSLRGNAIVYQGEELGLPQAKVPFEKLQDPEAIDNWPHTLGRDGARTPMCWLGEEPNAGFSTTEPWLPVDATHIERSADRQTENPNSVLSFYKTAIRLRKNEAALRIGDITFLEAPEDIVAFRRFTHTESVLVVLNLSGETRTWLPNNANGQILIATDGKNEGANLLAELAPYTGYVAKLA